MQMKFRYGASALSKVEVGNQEYRKCACGCNRIIPDDKLPWAKYYSKLCEGRVRRRRNGIPIRTEPQKAYITVFKKKTNYTVRLDIVRENVNVGSKTLAKFKTKDEADKFANELRSKFYD